MRTSTILGISISLSMGIILGWTVSTIVHGSSPAQPLPHPTASKALISSVAPKQKDPRLIRAERLLNTAKSQEALDILTDMAAAVDLSTDTGKEWLELLIDAYTVTENLPQLMLIYEQYPKSLSSNEQAALLVANSLLSEKKTAEYRLVRKPWKGKEQSPAQWTFLDAQEKLSDGKTSEAIALLQSKRFNGKEEIDRLTRLAAFYVVKDPQRSCNYLQEAIKKDPNNPDLHTFKAGLCETLGQKQAALSNYIAAIQNDPESPYRREQLADFCLRTGKHSEALKILQDTMSTPSLDTIWLKTLFWGRMVQPVPEMWLNEDIPEGSLKELVAYIQKMPSGVYWNERLFAKLPNSQDHLKSRQEVFWLQMVAALKKGDEQATQQLIDDNCFKYVSWNPELEQSIKAIIAYRQLQQSKGDTPSLSRFAGEEELNDPAKFLSLLTSLSELPPDELPSAIPHQLRKFLLSDEAFVLPFLAAGWKEAAIQLHRMDKFPDDTPERITEMFLQALQQNRGDRAALDFALLQNASPAISLYIAEIALELNEKPIAFEALKNIYAHQSEIGRRAALILSQFFMEHNNPKDAKKVIMAQPSLANDLTAQEILARVAIHEGDNNTAHSLYQKLENYSSEAKSFLARKAFADKQWKRARQLTEELLKEHPGNSTLIGNLKKIIAEEKKHRIKP